MDGQNGRRHDIDIRMKTPCTKRQTRAAKRKQSAPRPKPSASAQNNTRKHPRGPATAGPLVRFSSLDVSLQLVRTRVDEDGHQLALDRPADQHPEHPAGVALERVGGAGAAIAEVLELHEPSIDFRSPFSCFQERRVGPA